MREWEGMEKVDKKASCIRGDGYDDNGENGTIVNPPPPPGYLSIHCIQHKAIYIVETW